jgi:CheY-like chemotaxis protein
MLERQGYEVEIAADGVEAVSRLMSGDTHMIILDIMMPFFSGYWFCNIFKKNPATKDIPVVIVSALNKKSDVEKGLKLGADAYVRKPFTEKELTDVIRSVFEKYDKAKRKKQ